MSLEEESLFDPHQLPNTLVQSKKDPFVQPDHFSLTGFLERLWVFVGEDDRVSLEESWVWNSKEGRSQR